MKKFSNLITESNVDKGFMPHVTVSVEEWEKVKPLIELLHSEKYTENTRKMLKDLISCMNTDSMIYWQTNVKKEDSFEEFFKMFRINSDEDDIKDCIRDLIDNTDELHEDSNDNKGEFIIKIKGLRHKSIEEVKEDIKDAFSKLEMIDNTDFHFIFEVMKPIRSILVEKLNLRLPKTLFDGRPADIDAWFELNGIVGRALDQKKLWCKPDNIKSISLHIYNPETHIEKLVM
jgi:hypothetical protein